jgi:hypothetical protein
MAVDEELDEESWDIRETFAYFGRAFYSASCLEVGLAHALLFSGFMMEVRNKYVANKGKGFDQKQYQADFDAYMERQFAQTMGNIVRRVEPLPDLNQELNERIAAAKSRRDFLARIPARHGRARAASVP